MLPARGQCARLHGNPSRAMVPLRTLVDLPVPPRGFAHWDGLYACLRHLEYGRAVEKAAACRVAGPRAAAAIPGCRCERLGPEWCRPGRVRPSDLRRGRAALRTAAAACGEAKDRAEAEELLRSLDSSEAAAAAAEAAAAE